SLIVCVGNIVADHRLLPGDLAYSCHDTLLEMRKKEIVAGAQKVFHYLPVFLYIFLTNLYLYGL
ncbi:MAG: hypothetical protein RI905_25, partial [Pseudomonadota bacterium]